LDWRFEGIGWVLFLIMIGGIALIQNVPQGTLVLLPRTGHEISTDGQPAARLRRSGSRT
jgi:hypothetical protein